jgi:hypothetical protein
MMNRLLRSLIAIGLCLISTLPADEYHETLHKKLLYSLYGKEVTPFALISIPKSGTHLMINVLHHMAHAAPHWHAGYDPDFSPYYTSLWKNRNRYSYLCMHFCLQPAFEDLRKNINLKRIICIRDLRDICVSMVYHIRKKGWAGLNGNNPSAWNAFRQLSFDEQLLFVINYESYSHFPDDQWDLSRVARQAIQYCKEPNVLICPYESLVGEKGGGTQKAQLRKLACINEFLNLALSEKELIEISSKIYGDEHAPFGKKEGFTTFESTYRTAKIGSWKEAFKEEHKEAFKKKLGWALIVLGYEKNNNW